MTLLDALSKCSGFEWDKYNADKIQLKRNVTPSECEQVFFNLPTAASDDVRHSQIETRSYALGQTDAARLLFLVFTVRNDKIRVISARDMNRKERREYHSHEEENT
ncbi:MAG: BrnT family toxin [Chloroflexi bacterium]|nr:BrnT family toxin [Chloroflexota bacterium]